MEAFSTDSTMDSAAESISLVANLCKSCGLTEECRRRLLEYARDEELLARLRGFNVVEVRLPLFMLEVDEAEFRPLGI